MSCAQRIASTRFSQRTTDPYVATASTSASTLGSSTTTTYPTTTGAMETTTVLGQLYTGMASNVSNGSFTLTDSSDTACAVLTNANTLFWDENGDTIDPSTISNGDSIRLDGTVDANGALEASVVRDTSLGTSNQLNPPAGGSSSSSGTTGGSAPTTTY